MYYKSGPIFLCTAIRQVSPLAKWKVLSSEPRAYPIVTVLVPLDYLENEFIYIVVYLL